MQFIAFKRKTGKHFTNTERISFRTPSPCILLFNHPPLQPPPLSYKFYTIQIITKPKGVEPCFALEFLVALLTLWVIRRAYKLFFNLPSLTRQLLCSGVVPKKIAVPHAVSTAIFPTQHLHLLLSRFTFSLLTSLFYPQNS